MIEIILILTGMRHVKKYVRCLALTGIIWSLAGLLVIYDTLDGRLYFPLRFFAFLLLIESILTLFKVSKGQGTQRTLLYFKSSLFFTVSLLLLIQHNLSNFILAFMFGAAYLITGLFMLVSAWVVRYPYWYISAAHGIIQIVLAIFLLKLSEASVAFLIGFTMTTTGMAWLALAWRAEIASLGSGLSSYNPSPDTTRSSAIIPRHSLVVHIWTPEGSATTKPVRRYLFINRYIAAVDRHGQVSTGHAALEVSDVLYISFYPLQDIDRSPSDFIRLLKATRDNDMAGVFQPDYISEAEEWRHSDRKIVFNDINLALLEQHWRNYQQDKTYNLTWRNCSSSVAFALEAALSGALSVQRPGWRYWLKIALMPELWMAAQLRRRAMSMAWTPGLVMDYARALSAVIQASRKWSSSKRKKIAPPLVSSE